MSAVYSTTGENADFAKATPSGKYDWFDSTYKSYNLPEYFSGWEFEGEDKESKYHEYFNIK